MSTESQNPGSARLRILVVGCGAMGSLFAGHLSEVAEVVGFDANETHLDAIRSDGLRIAAGGEERVFRFEVTSDAAALAGRRFDAALFMVKSGATATVIETLGPTLDGAVLLTLQNGMGNAETLMQVAGARVGRGVTMEAGRYLGPGKVEHLIRGQTSWFGPVRVETHDLQPLAEAFSLAGLKAEVIPDPMGAVWSKFLFNAVMNPVGALVGGDNRARYEVPEVRALIDDMAAEGTAVIEALGGTFAFDPMGFVKKVRSGEVPLSSHCGSMALDIARGAPTEIEELTGFVVREGDRLGVPVEASRSVYRAVKGLEFAARKRASAS
ncbi:ketopantoate reductase family protein [Sagittula stellata]|uniref:2-dehydropantoate 2-reductase n=1 Tax=Sagittula stellata (strain ATCC 700073 / DSM 11524 / E-37) TaxID=388399 RepID=A3K481_SAGS3|nr:ketopantoate reductase family protein [Sagittula stellata]EBA07780.1 2-dehydropantoate 2-reductase [Sagittula stellata E-37]